MLPPVSFSGGVPFCRRGRRSAALLPATRRRSSPGQPCEHLLMQSACHLQWRRSATGPAALVPRRGRPSPGLQRSDLVLQREGARARCASPRAAARPRRSQALVAMAGPCRHRPWCAASRGWCRRRRRWPASPRRPRLRLAPAEQAAAEEQVGRGLCAICAPAARAALGGRVVQPDAVGQHRGHAAGRRGHRRRGSCA